MFAIGNVAPDSGVPDEAWEHYDPPKSVSHFEIPGDDVLYRSNDMAFYRKYLADGEIPQDRKRFSFLLGYFFHLITDNLWLLKIYRPAKRRWLAQFDSMNLFVQEMKRDWYGLDFAYVRANPDSVFWQVFLPGRYDAYYLDFFPKGAISNQLDYIKHFYRRTDDGIKKLRLSGNIYLSAEEMDAFVDSAAQDILKIYHLIWDYTIEIDNPVSALALLEENYVV